MGIYIKLFDTHSEYEAYTADTENFILPNVSYCKDVANVVHYNPYVPYDPYAGHEFVDLGLSVKWAKMNIGAETETDAGLYFQWGDISGYTASQVGTDKVFNWENYKYWTADIGDGSSGMTKYNKIDGKTTLEVGDDAAVANMGGLWRMPTEVEFNELLTASTITNEWISINGVYGRKFSLTADPTKYVFFPAAGTCANSSVYYVGNNGYYHSSSVVGVDVINIFSMFSNSEGCRMLNTGRKNGFTVRGVVG